jgi:hypothetical protein
VIEAVERQVGPGHRGPLVTGGKLELEGDSHTGQPPIWVREEKDA